MSPDSADFTGFDLGYNNDVMGGIALYRKLIVPPGEPYMDSIVGFNFQSLGLAVVYAITVLRAWYCELIDRAPRR